jgi:hypothetical protein
MLTKRISRRQIFKGSLDDGAEAGIIRTGQPILTVETLAQRQQFLVGVQEMVERIQGVFGG